MACSFGIVAFVMLIALSAWQLLSQHTALLQVEGVGSLSAAQASGVDSSRPDDLSSILQRLL